MPVCLQVTGEFHTSETPPGNWAGRDEVTNSYKRLSLWLAQPGGLEMLTTTYNRKKRQEQERKAQAERGLRLLLGEKHPSLKVALNLLSYQEEQVSEMPASAGEVSRLLAVVRERIRKARELRKRLAGEGLSEYSLRDLDNGIHFAEVLIVKLETALLVGIQK